MTISIDGTANTISGVPVNGPAFSAYQSVAQTPAGGFVKVSLQAKEFDTASAFDAVTNYRFAPPVAGYYSLTGAVMFSSAPANLLAAIYKNGVLTKQGQQLTAYSQTVSALIYLNGSTDYVELFVYQGSGGIPMNASGSQTYFHGFLARVA